MFSASSISLQEGDQFTADLDSALRIALCLHMVAAQLIVPVFGSKGTGESKLNTNKRSVDAVTDAPSIANPS